MRSYRMNDAHWAFENVYQPMFFAQKLRIMKEKHEKQIERRKTW